MLNALKIEPKRNDMSLICVDDRATSSPAEPLPVGRNFFSTTVVRPGSQPMVARLSLWFSLQESYKIATERGHYDITPTTFVVLNEGQRFELVGEPGTAPRAASLIFDQQYVADIARSFSAPLTAALEVDRDGLVVRFPECVQHESVFEIGPKLRALANACMRGDQPGVLAEKFRAATECLVLVYSAATRQIDSIDSVRPGTRAELYRRIQRAYVYIQDNYTDELCLEKIARAACMSPHHFHRVFSQVYGITPLRALADRRMQMAHKLLETTDTPVSAICRAVGYHSAPTFSNLFRAKFGVPPSLLQQRSRRVRLQYAG